jgi:hypothetical protein
MRWVMYIRHDESRVRIEGQSKRKSKSKAARTYLDIQYRHIVDNRFIFDITQTSQSYQRPQYQNHPIPSHPAIMKVILAGSSGFIGKEVLRQCLQNPSITSLIALSRRELPVTDPKLKTVLVDDFTAYKPEVLRELEGAESCIWYIYIRTSLLPAHKS